LLQQTNIEQKLRLSKKITVLTAATLILALLLIVGLHNTTTSNKKYGEFNGDEAFFHVEKQLAFGPRVIGSEAHKLTRNYIQSYLKDQGWIVEIQPEELSDSFLIHNITAKMGEKGSWLLLGAHYDSRLIADQDPDLSKVISPVPGANDGASGVAVLLELARVLPKNIDKRVWLVFFDAEDNGNVNGYDWIMGSQRYAENLSDYPDQVVIIDMVGDIDLDLYMEKNSDASLSREIWGIGDELGYSEFIPSQKYRMIDDHTPFLALGIPSVVIIDFDYPYWHTTMDTIDKVSPHSLEVVGQTLLTWLTR
jgi:Zn-dependent M28 family amino/carboxypeptidase